MSMILNLFPCGEDFNTLPSVSLIYIRQPSHDRETKQFKRHSCRITVTMFVKDLSKPIF